MCINAKNFVNYNENGILIFWIFCQLKQYYVKELTSLYTMNLAKH